MDNIKQYTKLTMSQVMLPGQANVAGNVHGGEIMKIMDSAAGAVAMRYARSNVVTARVDELEFHLPIFVGALVSCLAEVTYVGNSSMEIMVTVTVEDLEREGPPKQALSAYFTMVALDRTGRPQRIPPLEIDSEEGQRKFEEGKARYMAHSINKKKGAK